MFKPGAQVGRYHVTGAIGRGQPDGLYAVQDPGGSRFALRAPLGDLDDDTTVTARFGAVAEALRGLAHTNLVALLDVFIDQGLLCLVMEHVHGRTLASALEGVLSPRQSLIIMRQILAAAAYAHDHGRVHRDLRPRRILLVPMTGWELVKVADFGLGMMVDEAILAYGAGALTGSLPSPAAAYMAPEQVLGRSVDARTDIYALGAMLFEMLTGRTPFPDPDPQFVMQQQVKNPPPRLDALFPGADWCTPEMLALVETALDKDREQRYQTAADMIIAVERAFESIQHLPPDALP